MFMMTMMRRLSLVAALAVAAAPAAAAQPRLDEELAKAAPKVIAFLQEGKYGSVGVLSFLAHIGDSFERGDLGALNRNVARRLEVALVQNLPDDKILLISGAGDSVADAKNPRATHRTPSGRQLFFRLPEKLFNSAWGDKHVVPDVFLTGDAKIAPDWKSMTVKVQAFDMNHTEKLMDVCDFTAAVDARTLSEAGVSFARSRAAKEDDDDQPLAQAPKYLPPKLLPDASRTEDPDKSYAETAQQSPVKLEVLYNGKVMQPHGGIVETPGPDDKVSLRLKNEGRETCGVVLMVNGRNTIFHEEADALHCYKWILEPGESRVIEGFQKDDDTREAFDVKPVAESARMAVQYGRHAGTITMVVFRAANKDDEALVKADEDRTRDYVAIARGSMTPKGVRPNTLEALKGELAGEAKGDAASRSSRGLIVPGAEASSQVKRVNFSPFPRPVASVSIRYYQPK
jgi:hypothetical protein